jgi:ribonucleoside-triphosphate reductase (thioredoxin)
MDNSPLKTAYQNFIYYRTYSRWLESKSRREFWDETVNRYFDFFSKKVPKEKIDEFYLIKDYTFNLNVMPSMRAVWSAGKAAERENVCIYNCSYLVIDRLKAFAELMYILLNGTGVGFSVEKKYVTQLPKVPDDLKETEEILLFADNKLGWAEGYYKYIKALFSGKIMEYDLSKIRPEGSRLKTSGGTASGPAPLKQLLDYTKKTVVENQGKHLNSLQCHDLCCYIANVVVSGGVRRSACISLSDLADDRMRNAKSGEFWHHHPQRRLANNSAVYEEKPDTVTFLNEWISLIKSRTGERGIFNRESCKFIVTQTGRRDNSFLFGGNPCLEIILRPNSFCNLTEVVIRPDDTKEELCKKVRYATILGCVQATMTKFNFLGREWKKNCEEERLLGVSLTGLRDHPILNTVGKDAKLILSEMKQTAIDTAEEWSQILKINMPTAITCVKPSGTVSQLVDCASGLHTRYAPFYIRRVRVSKMDAVCKYLMSKNIIVNPEVQQTLENANTFVFDFYIRSPETAIIRDEVSALNQLEYWLMLQKYWCEHKPSVTISVKEDEWLEVGNWVYKNWDYISGISFLPYDSGIYQLSPYEEIDEEDYDNLIQEFPSLNFDELSEFESTDTTEGAKEYACSAGGCEI